MTLVCNDTSQSLAVTKSLDDEYTPGVFKVSSDVSQRMAVAGYDIMFFMSPFSTNCENVANLNKNMPKTQRL